MIRTTGSKLHWNYFIALERDLDVTSRYVEFCRSNFRVYSIEFAHLLFAAASEVDVIAKLLCERLRPGAPHGNINEYRLVLATLGLHKAKVFVPRYGLTLKPWANWARSKNPDWWKSYNNVKHQRDKHFKEATLQNALNSLGALLLLTYHHYSYETPAGTVPLPPKDVTDQLQPESTLLRLPDGYYRGHLLLE